MKPTDNNCIWKYNNGIECKCSDCSKCPHYKTEYHNK